MLNKLLWKLFGKRLLNYVREDLYNKAIKSDMKFAFIDMQGNKYYTFPTDLSLPVERLGKIQEYLMWISAGLNDEQLEDMLSTADKHLSDGLQNGNNAAKIGAIINEIRTRKQLIAPVDLFYNYLAVQYVREDENPKKFNPDIQAQKVEAFKEGAETNDSFFFQMPQLQSLSSLLSLQNVDWNDILKESKKQEAILSKKMEILKQ